jgi:hypothetical protein
VAETKEGGHVDPPLRLCFWLLRPYDLVLGGLLRPYGLVLGGLLRPYGPVLGDSLRPFDPVLGGHADQLQVVIV